MIFLDTNILLYRISPLESEQPKRAIAQGLMERSDCALSLQVLNEFVVQATRATRPMPISRAEAFQFVRVWRRFTIAPIDLALFDQASSIIAEANFSWWDCLIVAAATTLGCDTLATEDLQHGRVIDGVRIVNPFRELA